ncbi:DUF5666 domain-containing protein [Lichenicola sp.]|uniref:DUF5666 domain-containing protein n=1 Tax=Lichenicola sp. TaxID=2804529 RepID=UPI003AFFD57E
MTKLHSATAMLATTFGLLLAAGPASAQVPPRTRGVITAVSGDSVMLKNHSGTVTLKIGSTTGYIGARSASLGEVKAGRFIGTAAVPQPDGTLKALEVTVFPESMRGAGEGNYGWDLGKGSSMTNGTIGSVVGSSGRNMTVDYKGGQKTLMVPDDVPVVDLEPGAASLLKPGAHVVAFGPKAADGSVDAKRIIVGEDGTVPPM